MADFGRTIFTAMMVADVLKNFYLMIFVLVVDHIIELS